MKAKAREQRQDSGKRKWRRPASALRACLSLARKLLKRCYHTLRELGDEALTPA